MILYLDTSALVKRYALEEGSQGVMDLCDRADIVLISRVGYAEAVAALHRKVRAGHMGTAELSTKLRDLKQDWAAFSKVPVSPPVDENVEVLLSKHPLRGFDAIHRASAVLARQRTNEAVLFASTDKQLLVAARMEGFETHPSP